MADNMKIDRVEFNKTEDDIFDFVGLPKAGPDDTVEGGDDDETLEGGAANDGDDGDANDEATKVKPNADESKQKAAASDSAGDKGKSKSNDDKRQKGRPQLNAGDIVDRRSGQVVRAGAERRYYDEARQQRSRADTATQELTQVRGEFDAFKQGMAQINQFELAPDELVEGARLIAKWKKSPAEAVEEILATAKQAGVDLTKFDMNTIDTRAIKTMINQALDPIKQERANADNARAIKQESEKKLNTFLDNNPDAETCLMAVSRILMQDESVTGLESAYDKLQLWALRNGAEQHLDSIDMILDRKPDWSVQDAWEYLQDWAENNQIDLSKPLPRSAGDKQRDNKPARKPIPSANGRNVVASSRDDSIADKPKAKPAPAGTSLDKILRDAMSDAGFDVTRI